MNRAEINRRKESGTTLNDGSLSGKWKIPLEPTIEGYVENYTIKTRQGEHSPCLVSGITYLSTQHSPLHIGCL